MIAMLMLITNLYETIAAIIRAEWIYVAIFTVLTVVVYGTFTFGAFTEHRQFLLPANILHTILIILSGLFFLDFAIQVIISANQSNEKQEKFLLAYKDWITAADKEKLGFATVAGLLGVEIALFWGLDIVLTHIGWRCYAYLETDRIVPVQFTTA